MASFPKLSELIEAFVNDCYDFLIQYSDESTKKSIDNVLEQVKQKDELYKKLYVIYCSIFPFDPKNEGNLNVIYFSKKYIYVIYNFLSDSKNEDRSATKNDCCNTYIALHGFKYEYKAVLQKDLLGFLCDKYVHFSTLLNKYGILEKIKIYYEENIKSLENYLNSDKFEKKLLKNFRINNSIQIIYIDKAFVDMIKSVKFALKNEMCLKFLENDFKSIKLQENWIIYSGFNSNEININKKKIEFLENENKLLINNAKALTNSYNYNLRRKIINIILKNIFVILSKKNYSFEQKYSYAVLSELYKRKKEMSKHDSNNFQNEINIYKNNLYNQDSNSNLISSTSADKEKTFNLILVKKGNNYEVIPTLSIEFTFFLKEKANKLNHFKEEIFDLVLFEDMNNKICEKEYETLEGKNDEIENESHLDKKKFKGKTDFNGNEIIMMLENPNQFYKKETNIKKIFELYYKKIQEIESKYGFKDNTKKLSDLETDTTIINIQLKELIKNYEQHFDEIEINYKDSNKIENKDVNEDEKDNLNNYFKAKDLLNKVNNKIEYYRKIIKEISDINNIEISCEKNIDELINTDENKRKNEVEIKSIYELFDEFKKDMHDKIINVTQYKDYGSVFNIENINKFTINDYFNFLKDNLRNYSFSITKRDVTNFNFLIEVIRNYKQFSYVYNDNLDIKI